MQRSDNKPTQWMPAPSETIMSVLTPTGRGAVAVVAVSGADAIASVDACFLARNGKPLPAQGAGRIVYGHWGSPTGEDLVVCVVADDEVEVHCHGGRQTVAEVLRGLAERGCREIPWQEWARWKAPTRIEAEAQIALADAPTAQAAEILYAQYRGALAAELESILGLLASDQVTEAGAAIEKLLRWSEIGMHLTQPWQITIAGRPNVGKSSLVNAILGYERAIVADLPGTTRDVVSTTTAYAGWQLAVSDTAGLRQSLDELEAAGIARALEKLTRTDLVIWVFDAEAWLAEREIAAPAQIAALERELGAHCQKPYLAVINKIDRIEADVSWPEKCLLTSALTGQGIDELLEAIVEQLVPATPPLGQAVPFTHRQVELLRAAEEACREGERSRVGPLLQEIFEERG